MSGSAHSDLEVVARFSPLRTLLSPASLAGFVAFFAQILWTLIYICLLESHQRKKQKCKSIFSDKVTTFGKAVELRHYTIAFDRNVQDAMIANEEFNLTHLTKLYVQMVRPSAPRLIDTIKSAGHDTKNITQLVGEVSYKCVACKIHKQTPCRPIVAMPLAIPNSINCGDEHIIF